MILYRYIASAIIKPLLLSTVSFGGLVMISEFFREMSYYLEHKVSFLDVFAYLACNLPWWCIQVLPVSVLLAILFSLGDLARHNEITAIKASGVNLWRIILLCMLAGAAIGVADLALREFVIPPAVRAAEHIRDTRIHRETKKDRTQYSNHIVTLPGNARMTMGHLDLTAGTMTSIVIDFFNDDDVLVRQIVAASADWTGKQWVFHRGIERVFTPGASEDTAFDEKTGIVTIAPDTFVIKRVRPELLNTRAFREYIKTFRMIGMPVTNEQFQLHQRYAAVFSHMIVMCIGIPFALGLGGRHGKLISFTAALIFAFMYWGVQAVGKSLGENGLLTPVMAAWLANIIFSGVGLWMIRGVQK